LVILCGGFAVLQAPVFDGLAFDLLPFEQDGLAAFCPENFDDGQLRGRTPIPPIFHIN
jgi:hypothetical protein